MEATVKKYLHLIIFTVFLIVILLLIEWIIFKLLFALSFFQSKNNLNSYDVKMKKYEHFFLIFFISIMLLSFENSLIF